MKRKLVELRNINKYFGKVTANEEVSFTIKEGEVVALLGENGAGKSTIMKILYGLYAADSGSIVIDGKDTEIHSSKDAIHNGIAMIQQHFSLVPVHTVTENIILGNVQGIIHLKEFNEKIRAISEKYGFQVPVEEEIRNLSVGQQQKVEILKALYLNARILIMDEPTAVLTPQESEILIRFIKDFVSKGNSVVFITHKMKEVMEVADHIIVMRNGKITGDLERSDILEGSEGERQLSRLMMGTEINPVIREEIQSEGGEKLLSLEDVNLQKKNEPSKLEEMTFDLYDGEVFGVAGVSGNGQGELCEIICGIEKPTSGDIYFKSKNITNYTIKDRIDLGFGYVPVDRYQDALVMGMSLAENMMLKSSYDKSWRKGVFIDEDKLNNLTEDKLTEYSVTATGPAAIASELSGGNQQKVVLAREVMLGKHLIIFNQPTRGLDVGASNKIYETILKEKKRNKGVILVSTEISEILSLSDRFAVMYEGKFMGIYKNGTLTTEQIGLLMAGTKI